MTTFRATENYIVNPQLEEIVNVAVDLAKPLLVRGEPGTGKTLLAHAAAKALNMPLIRWHVKSTTKAQDGLYVYDAVQRLNDSRFQEKDVSDINQYIKLGPLGEAFSRDQRVVLLIDEIDKADLEFPNDLLHELDAMEFFIAETRQTVKAKNRPVVMMTSNAEKELPDAFLRRCLFHYIAFPTPEEMRQIVGVHFRNIDDKLLKICLQRFYWIRENFELMKPPSTSELLDWIQALQRGGIDASKLSKELPFMGTLLKREEDLDSLQHGRR